MRHAPRLVRRLRLFGPVAGVLLAATSARAQTGEPALRLEWHAPAECPAREAVLDEVARTLGPAASPRTPVLARATVERASERWRATVTLLTEGEEAPPRSFEGDSCASVASAIAVVLAVTVQGAGREPAANARRAKLRLLPRRPRTSPAAALGMASVGPSPSLVGGALLALGWRTRLGPGRLRLEVDAALTANESVRLSSKASEGADLAFQAFGARAAYVLALGPVDVGPALGVEVDRLMASGFSASQAFEQVAAYAALRAGLVASWAVVGPVALRAGAEALVPVAPPELVVASPNPSIPLPLFTPSAGARGMLGVEVRFL